MKKSEKIIKFFSLGWLLTVVALFLYSFTQIDLGLTLTRISFWQVIQRKFQSIGYFNRPFSTALYLIIIFILYSLYFVLLYLLTRKKLNLIPKQVWRLIFITAGILWLSYNAFSHDLFNYIFDARIITFYQQNPYQHKALDYFGDPMLRFMHWIHRYYPYGPLWLVFTVPLSFLGWQKLVPTMILFKGLAVLSYLGSCWFVDRILEKTKPKLRLIGLSVFALSPLVIIEGLVSAHNDILMMMLTLGAFWFLLKKQYWSAWLMLGLSIGIKFATALLVPVFFLVMFQQWRGKKINWEKIWLFSFFLMMVALMAVIKRDELKPWYLLYPLFFLAFLAEKKWLFWPMTGLSLGALLHYAPFLYLGNWDPPVPMVKLRLTLAFLFGGIIIYGLTLFREKTVKSNKVKSDLMIK